MLPLLYVKFLVIDLLLTQVLCIGVAEGVEAWLPLATSKSRQKPFLWHDTMEDFAFSSIAGQGSVSQSEIDRLIHKNLCDLYDQVYLLLLILVWIYIRY